MMVVCLLFLKNVSCLFTFQAQPLVGIGGRRSTYDEEYIECLRKATPGAEIIQVIDTRQSDQTWLFLAKIWLFFSQMAIFEIKWREILLCYL